MLRGLGLHTGLAFSAAVTLFFAIDLVETSNQIPTSAGLLDLLKLQLLGIPSATQQIAALVAIVGSTSAVSGFLRRGEIAAILSAGASPVVVLKPALVFGAVVAIGYATMTETVVPKARAEAAQVRRALGLPAKSSDALSGQRRWFRGKERIYRVEAIEDRDGRVLAGVLMLRLSGGRLTERWDMATLRFEDGEWYGRSVVQRSFPDPETLITTRTGTVALEIIESPRDFVRSLGDPDRLGYFPLRASIEAREKLGQPTVGHRLELYRRHAIPLMLVIVVLLGSGLAMLSGRGPSLALALGLGASVGFSLWLLDEVALALGTTSTISPEIAAHAALVLATAITAATWRRAIVHGIRAA